MQAQKLQNPKQLTHFSFKIPMPENGSITKYISHHVSGKSKKKSHKFDRFGYYLLEDKKQDKKQDKEQDKQEETKEEQKEDAEKNIIKILYRDENTLMKQSKYPFTDPLDQILSANQFSYLHPKKIVITQAVYIGHLGAGQDAKVIVKKVHAVKMNEQCTQFETLDDNFESIGISNIARFNQFVKMLSTNPKAQQMSIRVIINQSDPKNPQIIDYQFFKRQDQLKKSNKTFMNAGQKSQKIQQKAK